MGLRLKRWQQSTNEIGLCWVNDARSVDKCFLRKAPFHWNHWNSMQTLSDKSEEIISRWRKIMSDEKSCRNLKFQNKPDSLFSLEKNKWTWYYYFLKYFSKHIYVATLMFYSNKRSSMWYIDATQSAVTKTCPVY